MPFYFLRKIIKFENLQNMSEPNIIIPPSLNLDKRQMEHADELAKEYIRALDSSLYPNDYFPEICKFFKKRGLAICVGNPAGGILLTGINPSRSKSSSDVSFCYSFADSVIHSKKNSYWGKKRDLVGDALLNETAYLDLFPFGFTDQNSFEELIERNMSFRAAMLGITQREIEGYIKPKLIIVANKQSSYYWGTNPDATWMGYCMELVGDIPSSLIEKGLALYRITGFHSNRDDRINQDLLTNSNLEGTLILFYAMYDERNIDKMLTSKDVEELYLLAKNE